MSYRQLAKMVNDLTDALDGEDDLDATARGVRAQLVGIIESRDFDTSNERYESGARLKVQMSRGDSPRDQDTWTIEGKGRTHEDATLEFDALLSEVTEEYLDEVKETNPYTD